MSSVVSGSRRVERVALAAAMAQEMSQTLRTPSRELLRTLCGYANKRDIELHLSRGADLFEIGAPVQTPWGVLLAPIEALCYQKHQTVWSDTGLRLASLTPDQVLKVSEFEAGSETVGTHLVRAGNWFVFLKLSAYGVEWKRSSQMASLACTHYPHCLQAMEDVRWDWKVRDNGNTMLHLAFREGNYSASQLLLRKHPSMLRELNDQGKAPLHLLRSSWPSFFPLQRALMIESMSVAGIPCPTDLLEMNRV